MAVFTVHTPFEGASDPRFAEKTVFLRDGFSIPAFVFGLFWLLWRRAWLPAVGWFLLLGTIGFAGVKLGVSKPSLLLVNMALSVALGFEGPRLVAWALERKGLRESGVVSADDADEAEEIYFHNLKRADSEIKVEPIG